MEKLLILNPAVVYRQKNGVYAFYVDFNYFFFTGPAALLIEEMLKAIASGKSLEFLPNSFLDYLILKNIISEGKP